MLEHIKILPHPPVDRPIPALHRIMGLDDVTILQHIIGNQNTACAQTAAAHPAENEYTAPLLHP